MKKRLILIFLLFTAMALFIYCVFFYNYSPRERQKTEEKLVVEAIDYWLELEENLTAAEGETSAAAQIAPGTEADNQAVTEYTDEGNVVHIDIINNYNIEDNHYFQKNGVLFTPDYAAGALFCGLHYEKCGIMREVFIGDEAAIKANLDMWIPCVANPYMDFGITSICIKAHNHLEQNLSMNSLRKAEIGDTFDLISDSGVYIYEVTDIFRMPRELVEKTFDNDLLSYSADTCFIVTCGRDNFPVTHSKYMPGHSADYSNYKDKTDIADAYSDTPISSRYQDFVVEGHLINHININESEYATKKWQELKH